MIKELRSFGLRTDNRTYVIAEIGINHGGDIEKAKALIDSASRAGVDAVKFQTYLTEKRAPEGNTAVFDILKKCELPFEAFLDLKVYAEQKSVEFFSTAFDIESLNFLESISCPIYKLASFDVINRTLLKEVALTGKPVILSVGMASIDEIKEAYEILKSGTEKVALLHCISAYPTEEADANLAAIYSLQKNFDCLIGQSDHTNSIRVPLYAVASGAQIIEKHYKIDDKMDCIDAPVSITESQMKEMIKEIRNIEKMFGRGELGVRKAEEGTTVFRRLT
ncbi:MAG: N-acetylneuraminate synthase [Bacteroidetes bacterium]|nr:N-acetylneuraminate synthase [Bacteroidota bacterium]